MVGCGDQIAGVGEAVRRRLGIGNARWVHPEVPQIPAVERLLDGNGSQCRLGKGLHRRRIWSLGRRDRQRARELAEVDGVLDNVGLKAVATERTRREFGVERQSMNPLSRGFGPAPVIIRKSDHLNCILGVSTSISNSRSSYIV